MNDRGNISLELVFGFSVFISLLLPAVTEFSEITRANQQLNNYLEVLGRAWSLAPLEESETTLQSLKALLSDGQAFSMKYACNPDCVESDARLTLRLQMKINSVMIPVVKLEGTFARDFFAR